MTATDERREVTAALDALRGDEPLAVTRGVLGRYALVLLRDRDTDDVVAYNAAGRALLLSLHARERRARLHAAVVDAAAVVDDAASVWAKVAPQLPQVNCR